MKTRIIQLCLAITLAMSVLLGALGCGGASSSSGGTGNFQLFVTDDLHTGYSGVWVKVYKAQIKNSAGASTTLFDSVDGTTINLRQLNDGASKFLLLAPGVLADGTYNKIEFVLDKSVTLVASPSGTSSTGNFPASLDDSTAGRSKLEINLSPALVVPGATRVAIDFDLRNWTFVGGVVTPVLAVHPGTGLDDSARHERFEFKGLVRDLSGTSPTQTFLLGLRTGGTLTVATDANTSIVGDGASALANGLKAEVYGDYNPVTKTVSARVIKLESEFEDEAKAIGAASNIVELSNSFDVAPKYTRGFAPQGEKVSVVTNSTTTRFRGNHGSTLTSAQFYAALTAAGANAVVEVEGVYSSSTNTITAKSVHIENESELGGDEAKGTSSVPDAEAGTFSIQISEHEGFDAPESGLVPVKVSSATQYKNTNGNSMTKAAFFEALAAGSKVVKVEGIYKDGLFSPGKAELKASGGNN
ncbi:MAG: hypothetical protein CBB60_005010 [Armatimonadetes bacterium Cent15-Ar3]|nr:MAG: hypothetical protein CBB60_005010 [Armatimonadetes bacterium Cent15-Ar3]